MRRSCYAVAVAACLMAVVACAGAVDADAEQPQQKIFDTSIFPASLEARPPLWPFRTYADAKSWGCKWTPNGVLTMDVSHKLVKGVTSQMMIWMYNNMDTQLVAHPKTGVKYPMYLMLHPRDHVKFTMQQHPVVVKGEGAKLDMVEFPLTGCKHQPANSAAPWSCPTAPAANPGVTKATPEVAWKALSQTNSTLYLAVLGKKGAEFRVKGCNEKGTCAKIIRTKLIWKDTPEGLDLLTHQEIGLNLGLAAKSINPRIIKGWRNGENAEVKCARGALHNIEELGGLEHWLPQAYAQANKA